MSWSRLFVLWLLAVAIGASAGCILGATGSISYQAHLPVGDIYAPLVVMSSLVTAVVGAWAGFAA
ncbi:MAG: hypothetical protein Q7T71_03240, partial [Herbiconiux sp.]|nr:hypothetical protein [Herbiconiux sp.]